MVEYLHFGDNKAEGRRQEAEGRRQEAGGKKEGLSEKMSGETSQQTHQMRRMEIPRKISFTQKEGCKVEGNYNCLSELDIRG
ncbi:MAG: hypothetical protein F6J86_23955 [Symploca sp. SIO1B1]|nr:hypothetical protein [Symploca sp. SIO1B1]